MSQYCVLIVDDQKDSTSALKAIMERRDFDCHVATNIEDANKKLEQLAPHLLIVDVNLGPSVSGLDWLSEVRKGRFGSIPAVILTATGDEETVRAAVKIGVDDFIVKDSEPQTMTKKIVALRARLQESVRYALTSKEEPLTAQVKIAMQISAISETGICVSSHIANRLPVSFSNPSSSLFKEIEVKPLKKITFLNYERETNWKSKAPMRNFCQANGWTEPDFKRVRLWIRRNKLGRSF